MPSRRKSRANGQTRLETLIEYRFADPSLLEGALTHPSSGENVQVPQGYERLEFLGDRVLGLIVAELLLARYPAESEGALTRRLAALVRRETVLAAAQSIDLGRFIRTSASTSAKEVETAAADGCEALIGALYLDGGLPAAEAFVRRVWEPFFRDRGEATRDPKNALQEWLQGRGRPLPVYEVVDCQGPSHQPLFTVVARAASNEDTLNRDGPPVPSAEGSGRSKREAEQAAAAALLARLKVERQ